MLKFGASPFRSQLVDLVGSPDGLREVSPAEDLLQLLLKLADGRESGSYHNNIGDL
jgi:hypothetical protein